MRRDSQEEIQRVEAHLLGCLLHFEIAFLDVAALLRREDFYAACHQDLWSVLVELFDKNHSFALDVVADRLFKMGKLESFGGYAALANLYSLAPASVPALRLAIMVRDASLLRQLRHAAAEILQSATSPTDSAEQTLANAEGLIFRLSAIGRASGPVRFEETLPEVLERIQARRDRVGGVGMVTGFTDFDLLTSGLQPGELVLVAARPSVGKTSFAVSVALRGLLAGKKIFFASLEMSRIELAERLLVADSSVNSHRLRQGRLDANDHERLGVTASRLTPKPLWIDDAPAQNMLRIAANSRRLRLRHGIDLVIVDYLQLVEPENKREQRYEQIGAISRRLKGLARELGIPVLALTQLGRAAEDRRRPRLSDLRESGSQEQDADVVLLLHREEDKSGPVQPIVAILAKQRNGPTGEFDLAYHRQYMRFDDFADSPQSPFSDERRK